MSKKFFVSIEKVKVKYESTRRHHCPLGSCVQEDEPRIPNSIKWLLHTADYTSLTHKASGAPLLLDLHRGRLKTTSESLALLP